MTALTLESLDDIKIAMQVLDDKLSAEQAQHTLLDYAQHLQTSYLRPPHIEFLAEKLESV